MKSIPSLVASSTVGVAATGFVFGRRELSTPQRPMSNKRKADEINDGDVRLPSSPRPATSYATSNQARETESISSPFSSSSHGQNPSVTHIPMLAVDTLRSRSHTPTFGRQTEVAAVSEATSLVRKDSVSSRGSWMKRLSSIHTSGSGDSPRSSIGPDSPSLVMSNNSAVPILQTAFDIPTQAQPNKLVKRATSGCATHVNTAPSGGSRLQRPTLRRPATSRQRSATLQLQYLEQETGPSSNKQTSFSSPVPYPPHDREFAAADSPERWRHYFQARATRLTKDTSSTPSSDPVMPSQQSVLRRILQPDILAPPTLLKPNMLLDSEVQPNSSSRSYATDMQRQIDVFSDSSVMATPESTTESHKRPRRTMSMTFSSPTQWLSRAGSLRASKRGMGGKAANTRYASAPLSLPPRGIADLGDPADGCHGAYQERPATAISRLTNDETLSVVRPDAARNRNNSSPLPSLSRLSSFNLDLTRLGLSSSSSAASKATSASPGVSVPVALPSSSSPKPTLPSASSPFTNNYRHRQSRVTSLVTSEAASTLIGSDSEVKGSPMTEDDDMDFQSDTVFDSFRTGYTGSMRSRNPALESMFDDSPPVVVQKSRGPVQEIHRNISFLSSDDRIIEEDEPHSTPLKKESSAADEPFATPTRHTSNNYNALQSSPPSFYLASQGFGRLSLEDEEEDEDWTRDDDSFAISHSLSPPSSSVNSQLVNPAIRAALADVTNSSSSPANSGSGERPKSVFDWSEPAATDKSDITGHFPRPKTVHGKQGLDGRGGRLVGRRGPSAVHVRSQSVPVVPDINGHRENSKIAPKFGTWGLGAKGVSEDWDNDFDFATIDPEISGEGSQSASLDMHVPHAIQASQASVVGHVGQIREVCLLVDDLKRLRGLAREKGLLYGPAAELWREAEGIIALAIPDEEDAALATPIRMPCLSQDVNGIDDDTDDWTDETQQDETPARTNSVSSTAPRPSQQLYPGRRRSVFSPEDDIFGLGPSPMMPTTSDDGTKDEASHSFDMSTNVARSVMEHIHHNRNIHDPFPETVAATAQSKMPFDTTSLRDLVQRANTLARLLAEIIRKFDVASQSPRLSPGHDLDSSPAFTRVFSEPHSSPPRPLPRSQSTNAAITTSFDSSPSRSLGQRMHLMVV